MKAWVLHDIGTICREEVSNPVIAENEVLVHIKAVGICGSDIPRIYKTGAHFHPLILGHEFSGVVEKTGTLADKKWEGKRVGVFPLIPCKKCAPCKKQEYELCRQYSYLGSRRDGGFAEYVSVPEWNLIELPATVSFAEAAMLEPMAVAVHAMRRILLHQDDIVIVYGLGTIGMLLTMFLMDAKIHNILVIGNKLFQKRLVRKLGLPEYSYCDGREQDVAEWVQERTNGTGANVVFECVGKSETCTQAIRLAAPKGQVCLVGNPDSDIKFDKNTYWKILRNQLIVTGTWNSSFTHEPDDDWHYVLDCLSKKQVSPEKLITHRLPMEELEHGLRIMKEKTEDYVKIMLT